MKPMARFAMNVFRKTMNDRFALSTIKQIFVIKSCVLTGKN